MLFCVHLEVTARNFQVAQTAKEAEIEAEWNCCDKRQRAVLSCQQLFGLFFKQTLVLLPLPPSTPQKKENNCLKSLVKGKIQHTEQLEKNYGRNQLWPVAGTSG